MRCSRSASPLVFCSRTPRTLHAGPATSEASAAMILASMLSPPARRQAANRASTRRTWTAPHWPCPAAVGMSRRFNSAAIEACLQSAFLNEAPPDRRNVRLSIAKRVRRCMDGIVPEDEIVLMRSRRAENELDIGQRFEFDRVA
jgi:hypothetical protein